VAIVGFPAARFARPVRPSYEAPPAEQRKGTRGRANRRVRPNLATPSLAQEPKFNEFNFLLTEHDATVVLAEKHAANDSVSAASTAVVQAEFNFAKAQLDTEGRSEAEEIDRFSIGVSNSLTAVRHRPMLTRWARPSNCLC
jgi:hypothetical protein